ncbi:MAG: hypothetical protein EA428_15930 [Spirochaetaceae bacterium]|nr:MAG: hypothetical protein EA428_15930 [Spirochaetaceae bacterium]
MKVKSNRLFRVSLLLLIGLCSMQVLYAQEFKFQTRSDKNQRLTYVLGQTVEETISIWLRHKGPAVDYFVTANAGQHAGGNVQSRQALSTAGDGLQYQVYDGNGNILSATNGITGSFGANNQGRWQETTIEISLRILASAFPPAGDYTDTFDLELYIGSSATGNPVETADINLTVRMPEIVDLQVGPPGASYGSFGRAYNISIDPALPGVGDGAELLVLANTGFALEVSSDNGGFLTIGGLEDTVPYRFRFNGSWITIGGTGSFRITGVEQPTGVSGRSYPFYAEIDTYDDLPAAGTYSDVLNFTIVAP